MTCDVRKFGHRKRQLANFPELMQNQLFECQTEALLQEELDLHTAILNATNAVVMVLDWHGYIVRCNHAWEQITGYAFAEVTQPVWDLCLTPDQKDAVKLSFNQLLFDQKPIADRDNSTLVPIN